jgi:hypothetical protein
LNAAVFVCVSLCFAVAFAGPISVGVGTSVTSTPGEQDVLIDVTSDYVDSAENQHIFQVAVRVEVQSGVVMLNGQRMAQGVQATVQFGALFREVEAGTQKVITTRNAQVGVQALIQGRIVNGALSSLSVQMLLSEVDGSRLTQVRVQEVIMLVDANGQETGRNVRPIGLSDSQISTTAAAAETTAGTAKTTAQAIAPATPKPHVKDVITGTDIESDDSESDSSSDDKHHIRVVRWFRHQKLGVRIVVAALGFLFVLVVLRVLFVAVQSLCCAPAVRTTYLDNVKLHYVPISMNDSDEKVEEKKPLLF